MEFKVNRKDLQVKLKQFLTETKLTYKHPRRKQILNALITEKDQTVTFDGSNSKRTIFSSFSLLCRESVDGQIFIPSIELFLKSIKNAKGDDLALDFNDNRCKIKAKNKNTSFDITIREPHKALVKFNAEFSEERKGFTKWFEITKGEELKDVYNEIMTFVLYRTAYFTTDTSLKIKCENINPENGEIVRDYNNSFDVKVYDQKEFKILNTYIIFPRLKGKTIFYYRMVGEKLRVLIRNEGVYWVVKENAGSSS